MQTLTFSKIPPKEGKISRNSYSKVRKKCRNCHEIFNPKSSGTLFCEKCINKNVE